MSDEAHNLDDEPERGSTALAVVKPAGRTAFNINAQNLDLGKIDTLRYNILSLAAEGNYERASKELGDYVELKREYPQFRDRVSRYISHCNDLLNAIKAKKSFVGYRSLSMSKQQELRQRAFDHLEELKDTLKRIEAIETQLRLEDIRSTVWVVKTFVVCTIVVLTLAFVRELTSGIIYSASVVLDQVSSHFVTSIFEKFGL
jgi:hypothetical protein